ncbi:MAG: isopenicillin N synthase family oxygenase [Coraliomargarita sp. TMED73]|nr:MAG: isopenicillin N synthase family oxygenase [Coraliomargarita sp. TMED73]|tara:strand:- start:3662 stop:4579 length:918 start_codon:yes stop_codon:yes gene_type:complete
MKEHSATTVTTLQLSSYLKGNEAEKQAFRTRLYESLKDTGFIILTDHGIDLSRLHKAYATVTAFFDLPNEEKNKYIVGSGGQRGFTPYGKEHAKGSKAADLKEFWHVGRDSIEPNVWPENLSDFKEDVGWLFEALDTTGLLLLEALTEPLNVSKQYFEEIASGGNSILRLLHYPEIATDVDPQSIRAAAHSDINLITLLVSASATGLELLGRDNVWREIEAPGDAIIADAGDMLARITNDHIPATIHRVVNPDNSRERRFSMPFFLHPRPDAVLSCLSQFRDGNEAPDTTGQKFLEERLVEIGLK